MVKHGAGHQNAAELEAREQEVLRASRELAAYFKGRRTEREARAALKIIKAFVRDRERMDPASRRPLPGAATAKATPKARTRKSAPGDHKVRRRSARIQSQHATPNSEDARARLSPLSDTAPPPDE